MCTTRRRGRCGPSSRSNPARRRSTSAAPRCRPRRTSGTSAAASTSTSCGAGSSIAAYDVTFVRNVTDIDDKILAKSAEAGAPWWAWAAPQRAGVHRGLTTCSAACPPTYEPRATGHVTEMIELMQRLIDGGHAYAADGDVYFDVRSYPAYGDAVRAAARRDAGGRATATATTRKRDPRDFALWKRHKDGEPETAVLADAVGTRPAGLAPRVLGDGDEVPRRRRSTSTAAASTSSSRTTRTRSRSRPRPATGSRGTGCTTAWVTIGGEKMSKSLGNSLLVARDRQAVATGRAALLPRRGALPLARRVLRGGARRGRGGVPPDRELRRAAGAIAGGVVADGALPDGVRDGDGRRPRRAGRPRRRARDRAQRQRRARRRRRRGGHRRVPRPWSAMTRRSASSPDRLGGRCRLGPHARRRRARAGRPRAAHRGARAQGLRGGRRHPRPTRSGGRRPSRTPPTARAGP